MSFPITVTRMIKKLALTLIILSSFCFKAQAVGVSDIDAIVAGTLLIEQDILLMKRLAHQLVALRETNFVLTVADSTQTVTLSALQKQGLIAKYQDLKAQLATDFNQLP